VIAQGTQPSGNPRGGNGRKFCAKVYIPIKHQYFTRGIRLSKTGEPERRIPTYKESGQKSRRDDRGGTTRLKEPR